MSGGKKRSDKSKGLGSGFVAHHTFHTELSPMDAFHPRVIRIVEKFGPLRREDNEEARRVMQSVVKRLRSCQLKTDYLIGAGGFLRCDWPGGLKVENPQKPRRSHLECLKERGKEAGDTFLKEFAVELRQITRYVSFGIDCSDDNNREAELIYFRDLSTNRVDVSGKSYPTSAQARELVCFDIKSHCVKANGEKVLLLGCHDMNLFSNRAKTNAKPGGFRSKQIRDMRRNAKKHDPTLLLQHPHTTDSANVWKSAMRTARKELKHLSTLASAGRYYCEDGEPRMNLGRTLEGTAMGSVLTTVVS